MTMVMVTLRAEAESEAIRLAEARSRVRDQDEDALARLEADGPWIVIARRAALRRRLGRRVLMLWRVGYEDATGRTAESRLSAIAIQLRTSPPAARTRDWIDGFLRFVYAEVRAQVEADVRGWHDAVATTNQSFSATRLARERAIAASRRATDLEAFQPGLFDRRAERVRLVRAGAVADGDRDANARLAGLERAAAVVQQPARLLLVVVPPC
jgi:hypothetical protein